MAVTVEILADGTIRYSPSNVVHRGETVTFSVDGIPYDVTVTFDTPCCFTSSDPLTLNSSNTATTASPETVSTSAEVRKYYFTADIPDEHRKKFPNWEAKRGELDVSTDPEEDKKDKRR